MTQVVVDYIDNKVVQVDEINQVIVNDRQATVIVTGMMAPALAASISGAIDIDKSGLEDGAMLVYDAITSKWACTTRLEKQIFEAGQY